MNSVKKNNFAFKEIVNFLENMSECKIFVQKIELKITIMIC